MPPPLNVVGVAEVAAMFPNKHDSERGMVAESVSRWIKDGTLPEPDATLAMGPVWRRSTIVAWANKTGRTLRYDN